MAKKQTTISKNKVAAAAGVAAAGAGAYYLLGPKGKAHQKKAKALLVKMEREIKAHEKEIKILAVKLKQGYDQMQGGQSRPVKRATSKKKKSK